MLPNCQTLDKCNLGSWRHQDQYKHFWEHTFSNLHAATKTTRSWSGSPEKFSLQGQWGKHGSACRNGGQKHKATAHSQECAFPSWKPDISAVQTLSFSQNIAWVLHGTKCRAIKINQPKDHYGVPVTEADFKPSLSFVPLLMRALKYQVLYPV